MRFLKPKFWDYKNSMLSYLLLPVSFFLQILLRLKKKFSNPNSFNIPVICVGNIYIGGTGKTPLVITIAKELEILGKKPSIIKKYYAEHADEYNLISHQANCLYVDKDRTVAISKAQKKQHDFAILDDGFQDYSIKKNFNIICFNSNQLIGNGMTLPSGPLRESLSRIKKANIIIINGKKNDIFEKKIKDISNEIKIYYSRYVLYDYEKIKNKKLFAFAGIGNPINFFKLLEENNLNVKKQLAFPDHYQFTKNELKNLIEKASNYTLDLVTTEKDYFRIKDYGFNDIKFVKIKLNILDKQKIINEILSIKC